MIILGIESSCDDTSVALIEYKNNKITVLAENTASQIDIHKKYGGVVPEIAGRKHAEKIVPLIEETLKNQPQPDAIAVTAGPGLMTGLLVGVEAAKTLSYLKKIPLVRVNHIEGHIYAPLLNPEQSFDFPTLALIVSGGHTEFILINDHGTYEKIGGTRDDAAGECFDKIAKMLDLPYPGGPQISQLAEQGDPTAIDFPRPMLKDDTLDMSFSGLKTAALYWLRDHDLEDENTPSKADFCASAEQAIVDLLVTKTTCAIDTYNPKTVIVSGGVSANSKLRQTLKEHIHIPVLFPPKRYCMDNATMIAVAGAFHAQKKDYTDWKNLQADPAWRIYPSS